MLNFNQTLSSTLRLIWFLFLIFVSGLVVIVVDGGFFSPFVHVTKGSMLMLTLENQRHKTIKHTQTVCRQKPTNCLSLFDHFVGLALKGLMMSFCNTVPYTAILLEVLIMKNPPSANQTGESVQNLILTLLN